jgi:Raf kinase inhibitor-like YbhB/YbcL family protein
MRRLAAAAVLAAMSLACTHDGRNITAPRPGATVPPSSSTTVATTAPGAVIGTDAPFVMTSPDFIEGGGLNDRFTCYGAGISPPLQWSGVPSGTVELALAVTDEDEGGVIHWVMTGLDPELVGLGAGTTPESAVQAVNDTGSSGWYGPCNDPNGPSHHYVFTLYALKAPSGVAPGADAVGALEAVKRQAAAEAAITGLYPGPVD